MTTKVVKMAPRPCFTSKNVPPYFTEKSFSGGMSPPEKLKKTNFGGNPPRAKATAASQSHRREPKPPPRAKA
ncbi:MAG: hypothetical protein ACLVLG_09010, partial [Anaerovoracaceae bacterium]